MRVIVWFYNHRDALNPLMDENIDVEDEESEDEDEDIDEEEEYEQDDLETVKWICQIDVVEILKKQILSMFLRDVIESKKATFRSVKNIFFFT